MQETIISLPGSDREYTFRIATKNLGEILSPADIASKKGLPQLVRRALSHPVGCSPLPEQVRPDLKVLIIVDDNTRGTPTSDIIPILLEHLTNAGCRERDITFALALGTHRPMTDSEIAKKLGPDIARQFQIINTPAQQRDAFVDTGESWDGVPIEVHHVVLESDIVIGIGSTVPHADAGWSGGAKIVLPGMCSERTVIENHVLAASFRGNMLGQASTSLRENMEAVVQRIGLDYVINVVMTPYDEVIDVFGGHFVAAQRAAVEVARRIYGVSFTEKASVIVSNAYPGEIDLWQGSKGIWAGELMVKRGGTVILNAPCHEGIGPHPEYLQLMTRRPERLLNDIRMGLLEDKNVAAAASQIARMLEYMHLAIVSDGLRGEEVNGGRIALFSSLQAAVDTYLSRSESDCKVNVITHGGYTYPIQV